jgi:hypothetical protein
MEKSSFKTLLVVAVLLVVGWLLYKRYGRSSLLIGGARVPAPLTPKGTVPSPGVALKVNPLGARPTAVPLGGAPPPPKKLDTPIVMTAPAVAAANVANALVANPTVPKNQVVGSVFYDPNASLVPLRLSTPPPVRVF